MSLKPILPGGFVAIPASGGGGSQSLAEVLAVGNDANALAITNVADPTNPQDAATRAYVLANSGSQTPWTSDIDAATFALKNVSAIYVGASTDDGTGNALQVTGGASINGSAGVFYIGNSPSGSPTFGAGFVYVGDADTQVCAFYDHLNNGWAQLTNGDGTSVLIQGQVPGSAYSNLFLNPNGGTLSLGNGSVFVPNLPTSDPGVSGQLWNNLGILTISP